MKSFFRRNWRGKRPYRDLLKIKRTKYRDQEENDKTTKNREELKNKKKERKKITLLRSTSEMWGTYHV